MIEGIQVEVKQFMVEIDFNRLLKYALPFEDGMMCHTENGVRHFKIHPSHVRSANAILKHYDVHIEVNKVVQGTVETQGDVKDKNAYIITFTENGIIARNKKTGAEHFVPNRNVEILLKIIKEGDTLDSRSIFNKLIEEHNLFPVYKDVVKFIYESNKPQAVKDMWVSELMEYRNSAFEGLRINKKDKDLTYYKLYNFPSLALRYLGLLEQSGTGKNLVVSITQLGKDVEDWRQVLKE